MAVDTIYLKNEQGVDVPYQIGADSRNVTYSPNAETVEGSVHKELQKNNIHKNTIIANNAGVHGLRYTNNKLQVQVPGGDWTPIDFGTGDMKKADYDEPGQDGVIGTEHGGTGNTSGYIRTGAKSGSTIGSGATAEGGDTIASGVASHAEGIESQATGIGSHAEGGSIEEYQGATYIGNGGAATGLGSHAEGSDTTASGNQSHAEGIKSEATGMGSHAEGGYYTSNTLNPRDRVQYPGGTATGHSSHAEGTKTQAIGNSSHAEGNDTTASGDQSHAEGRKNIAAGDYSHVGGQGNIITENGRSSIAHGKQNKVTNENSLVIGEYIQVNGSNSLVVGSGKNSTPTLEQDCVNKISNPNGITAFNGLNGKFQNKIPTGQFSDQPITFSATTSRQYNSTIQGYDGTFGAFIELVGTETQKVLIAPYGMYLISVSGYYNADASSPSGSVVAAAMYFCIGPAEIGGPGRVLRIEGGAQDDIQRPTISLQSGGILEITGIENINMQVQLIRLA